MKKYTRWFLSFVVTAILFIAITMTASASDFRNGMRMQFEKVGESVSALADRSVGLKIGNAMLNTAIQPQKTVSELFADKTPTNVLFLSPQDVDALAKQIADSSEIYLVELKDGKQTYYMAVDFRGDNAVYFSNLFVVRATSRKLFEKSVSMSEKYSSDQLRLMDYTHIVGELELHYVGYRVTSSMGGEKLPGLLGRVYNSCKVADLNTDEGRMFGMIRVVGLLIG